MQTDLAKVNIEELARRINARLNETYSPAYIGKVRSGWAGAASLKDVLHQEEQKMLFEAAELVGKQ